jgi:hypothetical protein
MTESSFFEEFMATTIPDARASALGPVSSGYIERLEEIAQRHGWTVDQAMRSFLKGLPLHGAKRYAIQIKD